MTRITVSGLPGSGTTSLAGYLAGKHGLRQISAGEVFRHLAEERGMDLPAFGALAETDPSIDKLIDARQKEIGEQQDRIVIEGRLSGWMIDNADLRIWLTAPLDCRAERISGRDMMEREEAIDATKERQASESRRYLEYYRIDISDLSQYHLVLSSEKWNVEELGAIVDTAIQYL